MLAVLLLGHFGINYQNRWVNLPYAKTENVSKRALDQDILQ